MLKKWWKYEKLKNQLTKKKVSNPKILSIQKISFLKTSYYYNILCYQSSKTDLLNCYPSICKSSRKFKKNIKLGRTTRWVFFHNLKKEKVSNIIKYVW